MKDAIEFIRRLSRRGIDLWVQVGRLKYGVSKGVLTDDIRSQLVEKKDEIIKV